MGLLVAKTLTNATANPFLAGGAGAYNPVLALDVFLVQVCTLHCDPSALYSLLAVAKHHCAAKAVERCPKTRIIEHLMHPYRYQCYQTSACEFCMNAFAVQASTNTLLSHFVSLLSSLWILLQISQKPPVPPESLGAVPARA